MAARPVDGYLAAADPWSPPWWAVAGISALVALGVAAYVVLLLVVVRLNDDVASIKQDACHAISDTRVQLALLDDHAGLADVPLPANCRP